MFPLCHRLAGEPVDEVDADVVDALVLQSANDLDGCGCVMATADEAQQGVVERLDAERDAVETTFSGCPLVQEGCQVRIVSRGRYVFTFAWRDGEGPVVGIHFQGHFGLGVDVIVLVDGLEDLTKQGGGEQ